MHHMTNTHISALPNEVLAEIFTELKDNSLLETWQKLTSVCRHWRAVALEAAILWTRPPTAHHEYTLLMLERSQRSPLEITLHPRTRKATTIAVLNHIGRISNLTICDLPEEALRDFQTTLLRLARKASQLRSLHIENRASARFKLSATTFLGPSSLKSLSLTSIDFDWQLLPIRSLTFLSLERVRMSKGPSWAQFLDALREMPLLEDLVFGFCDLQLNSPPIVSESLQMPYLRRLNIKSGRSSVIRKFLLPTTFPQLQKVHVLCSSNDSKDPNDYSAVINASLSLITGGDFGRFDHVEFAANHFMMSQLSPPDWKSRRTLEFMCPHTQHGRLALDAMAGISALPGDRTSDIVQVVSHASLASQNFTDLFGHLPRLESLRAYVCSKVIESLKVPPLHPTDSPIPFPRLQKITLDEGRIHYDALFKELGNSLMTRRDYGSEVKELCLNCQLTKEEAQLLQEVVVDLDFWGYTKFRRVVEADMLDPEGTDEEEHWIVDFDFDFNHITQPQTQQHDISRPIPMDPSPSMDPEEAQRLIDEEILVLKTRRNTYARISRLPNEVLVAIFATLRANDKDHHVSDVQAWHHVSHICRHWRRVSLESAMLWTCPPTHLHDYTLLMLERSRTSALEIEIAYNMASESTSTAVLSHIGRIETLLVIEQSDLALRNFQRTLLTLAQEAPLLETLEISQEYESSSDVFRVSTALIHRFPSLNILSLGNIDLDWTIFPLRSLTWLSLVSLKLSKKPSWTQFYDVLRQMPSLEGLEFWFDDLQLFSPPYHAVEPLQLPLLHTLSILQSHASVTRSFLSNTSLPRLRKATFRCLFGESSDLDEYSTTIDVVLPLITKGNFCCFDRLIIFDDSFTLSKNSDPFGRWGERDILDFTATHMRHPDPSSASRNARKLMAGLAALPTNPTSKIAHLTVSKLPSELLSELFGHLPQLESITGWNTFSQAIIASLKISPLHPPELPIPFPNVNSVELHGQSHENDYSPELFEELCDCLTARHKYGAGMSKLSLLWVLTEEEVQRLQEVIAVVKSRKRALPILPVENLQDEEDEDVSVGDSD